MSAAVISPWRAATPSRRRAASRHDLAFAREVLAGLASPRKSISGRWRFDARGLVLREAIERSDAASPARLERSLLATSAAPIATLAGADARLVALGGDDAPGLDLVRAAIDRLGVAATRPARRRILFVPGRLTAAMPSETMSARLRQAARHRRYDVLIVAGAAVRDPAWIAAADSEHAALRCELDRNVLVRMRGELGADLDPEAFDREIGFDAPRHCIETTLVSRASQRIRVLGRSFELGDGEPIVVERAHQHCLPCFEPLARAAGWAHAQLWIDSNARFAIHVLERA
jgi:uncharacterized SAM-dependent methyltransferase